VSVRLDAACAQCHGVLPANPKTCDGINGDYSQWKINGEQSNFPQQCTSDRKKLKINEETIFL
jgi:hypothetical protein